jgi:hypothetical protein
MTPASTEKVDFSQKKKTHTKQKNINRKNHQKNQIKTRKKPCK